VSPPSDDSEEFPPAIVVVVDTSVLIGLKKLVPIKRQWALFTLMTGLVARGHLAFPRQVSREMEAGKHPDAPGVWTVGCKGSARHPEPHDHSVAEVLVAAQIVDPNAEAEAEAADPYVAAMALEVRKRHPRCDVAVATDDYVDRMPAKESLATACARLGLQRWTADEFVEWLNEQQP